jgi:hypothetical protein
MTLGPERWEEMRIETEVELRIRYGIRGENESRIRWLEEIKRKFFEEGGDHEQTRQTT